MVKIVLPTMAILLVVLALSACSTPAPDSSGTEAGGAAAGSAERVEILLPMGEADTGKQVFVNLGCTSCHVVSGVEDLPPPADLEAAVDLAESARGLSRSAILTSIISPAHVNSQTHELWADWAGEQRVWLGPGQQSEEEEASERIVSRMRNYRSVMTVEQLSDMAAFVESVASRK